MSDLKSAIYGLAVGDALGVPFEFKKRGSFKCTDMTGYGTYNKPPGTWSDDTSMTIATCKSIKENSKKIVLQDIASRFKSWLFNGEYTPFGDVFDCGITTQRALKKGAGLNDFYSNGNGSLMRILPLAFVECEKEEIEKVSAITHAHEISKEACKIYVGIAKKLILGEDIKETIGNIQVSDDYSRIKIIDTLKENEIKSTGYVVDTLEACLWCIVNTSSYEKAVLKAVNLGEDTDTIAAVTGGLAGIIYGYDSIPKKWLATLKSKRVIDECLF